MAEKINMVELQQTIEKVERQLVSVTAQTEKWKDTFGSLFSSKHEQFEVLLEQVAELEKVLEKLNNLKNSSKGEDVTFFENEFGTTELDRIEILFKNISKYANILQTEFHKLYPPVEEVKEQIEQTSSALENMAKNSGKTATEELNKTLAEANEISAQELMLLVSKAREEQEAAQATEKSTKAKQENTEAKKQNKKATEEESKAIETASKKSQQETTNIQKATKAKEENTKVRKTRKAAVDAGKEASEKSAKAVAAETANIEKNTKAVEENNKKKSKTPAPKAATSKEPTPINSSSSQTTGTTAEAQKKSNDELERAQKLIPNVIHQWTLWSIRNKEVLDENQELKDRFTGLMDELSKADSPKSVVKLKEKFEELKISVRDFKKEINTSDKSISAMVADTARLAAAIETKIVDGLYRVSVNTIKEIVNQVQVLDERLVEIRKVTNFTESELSAFVKQVKAIGNATATSTSDLLQASATFARSGYTKEQIAMLTEEAAVLKNVSDGIKDMSQASEVLISIMKAYQIPASRAREITDQLNNISNNAAISFDDLAEGIQRTGAVYANAGTSIGELSALLTGANEVNVLPLYMATYNNQPIELLGTP